MEIIADQKKFRIISGVGRRLLLTNVPELFVENGAIEHQGDIVVKNIDKSIKVQMIDLFTAIPRHIVFDLTQLVTSVELWTKRADLIKRLNLEESEVLIQVLLAIAPWGIDDDDKQDIKSPTSNPEIHRTLSKLIELFNLIEIEESLTTGNLNVPLGASLEWYLESAAFKFRYKDGSKKDHLIKFSGGYGGFLIHILADYLSLLNGSGTSVESRLSEMRKYTPKEDRQPVKNPHYAFTFNFINFLEETERSSKSSHTSRSEKYRIYDELLKEAGHTINSEAVANRIKNLQQWYKSGEIQVAEYQRNNPDILLW